MVYTEKDSFIELQRKHTKTILETIGRTITLYSVTETRNAMGRIATYTEASATTFTGDIQFLTEEDIQHLNEGEVGIGEAKLFCEYDVTLNKDDEIELESQRWKLVRKINSPDTDASRDFQEWLLQRIG